MRLFNVFQTNCDPDSDKVLLHIVLTSNGLYTDVLRTYGSHWIYDRTMECMHSDAQFAGMILGIGNNPIVGCTVACAVDVATALNK